MDRFFQLVGKPYALKQRGGLFPALPAEEAEHGWKKVHIGKGGVQHVLQDADVFHKGKVLIDGTDALLDTGFLPASGMLQMTS